VFCVVVVVVMVPGLLGGHVESLPGLPVSCVAELLPSVEGMAENELHTHTHTLISM